MEDGREAVRARCTPLNPPSVADLQWRSDFNGDDEWDLAWQHADGRISVWWMRGSQTVRGHIDLSAAGRGYDVAYSRHRRRQPRRLHRPAVAEHRRSANLGVADE